MNKKFKFLEILNWYTNYLRSDDVKMTFQLGYHSELLPVYTLFLILHFGFGSVVEELLRSTSVNFSKDVVLIFEANGQTSSLSCEPSPSKSSTQEVPTGLAKMQKCKWLNLKKLLFIFVFKIFANINLFKEIWLVST